MTPEDVDAELDRMRQELAVIGLNVRAEMTAIDRLRSRMRHAGLTAGCTCRDCETP